MRRPVGAEADYFKRLAIAQSSGCWPPHLNDADKPISERSPDSELVPGYSLMVPVNLIHELDRGRSFKRDGL